jgi:hypothetical protein
MFSTVIYNRNNFSIGEVASSKLQLATCHVGGTNILSVIKLQLGIFAMPIIKKA